MGRLSLQNQTNRGQQQSGSHISTKIVSSIWKIERDKNVDRTPGQSSLFTKEGGDGISPLLLLADNRRAIAMFVSHLTAFIVTAHRATQPKHAIQTTPFAAKCHIDVFYFWYAWHTVSLFFNKPRNWACTSLAVVTADMLAALSLIETKAHSPTISTKFSCPCARIDT